MAISYPVAGEDMNLYVLQNKLLYRFLLEIGAWSYLFLYVINIPLEPKIDLMRG